MLSKKWGQQLPKSQVVRARELDSGFVNLGEPLGDNAM